MKNTLLALLTFFLVLNSANAQIITTIAGTGTSGYNGDSIAATSADLNLPEGVATDAAGNVYIMEMDGNRIRKINTAGFITTIAGTGTAGFTTNGIQATAATLNRPIDAVVDAAGNIYFVQYSYSFVYKISTSGVISIIAGGGSSGANGVPATTAALGGPFNIGIDVGNNLYISEHYSDRIRKINPAGIITTIAGTGSSGYTGDGGPATDAKIRRPWGVAADAAGNVYFADGDNNRVRKIDPAGIVTTIAGNGNIGFSGDGGPATNAKLNTPFGITADALGYVYFYDTYNSRVRVISPSGFINTVVGDDSCGYSGDGGPASAALLCGPGTISINHAGDLYIADATNSRVRKVALAGLALAGFNAVKSSIAIAPNPTSGAFEVNISSPTDEELQLSIINAIGQKVKQTIIFSNKPNTLDTHLPSGIYYLSAVGKSAVYNTRIVVQ